MKVKFIEWLEISKKKGVIRIKPENFGKQDRNLSEEIDEVLYSGNL